MALDNRSKPTCTRASVGHRNTYNATRNRRGRCGGERSFADARGTGEVAPNARRTATDRFPASALPVIEGVKAAGVTSIDAIAMVLNARGIRTARGGRWHSTTVRNLLAQQREVG
jgi:Recombinase